VFWLASLVLLSWPLRVFVQYKIAYVHYYIHKVFGVVSGQRDASMANSCSDVALPSNNNNTLIPSYSEAMRMDHCGRTESTELLTCQTVASATRNVELAPETGSAALVPLLQGFRRPRHDRAGVLSAAAGGTGRTMYGTVICDRAARAFFRSAHCPPHHQAPVSVQPWSTREVTGSAVVGLRSRRRDAVHKRKRRRSYNEAVGAPSGSDTSLAVTRADLQQSERARGRRRGRTSSAADADVVGGMTTSMSTPESFDKLQNASAWVEQLRHVKSFVEGGIRASPDEADNDEVAAAPPVNHESSSTVQTSADGDRVSAAAVPPSSQLAQSAYDVVGRRVVRCRQDWVNHDVDDEFDDDDDLPPSYEDAVRMRIVPYDVNAGIHLDDISSVSTTSTYLSSELGGVGDTPRRWKTFVRRPYAVVELPSFHVETSL